MIWLGRRLWVVKSNLLWFELALEFGILGSHVLFVNCT